MRPSSVRSSKAATSTTTEARRKRSSRRSPDDLLFDELPTLKPPSHVKRRLVRSATEIAELDDPASILFQHSVLCQTCLPYRDPGDDVREWDRFNGGAHLKVKAGEVMHPVHRRLVPVGLPFGPKPRLILAHLSTEALRTGSRVVEVEASLTAFVKRLSLATHGRNVRIIKEQLVRLAAASITLGYMRDGKAATAKRQFVDDFELLSPETGEPVPWTSTVCLSQEFFGSLQRHAVPLDERALVALSNSAMALDIYSWLAQRLHRVPAGKPQLVPWSVLKDQFGWNYDRMDNFKPVFGQALAAVHRRYPAARFTPDGRGITLHNSPPPIPKRMVLISRPELRDAPASA